jgi:hypothetical protein
MKNMPSSVIDTMIYDEASSKLRIVFVSGAIYEYKKVPAVVFTAMKNASSKGTYLNRHIKGKYSFKKIS